MADEENRAKEQPSAGGSQPGQNKADNQQRLSTQEERDRQNRDDPSRAPESGDRK
ncbi:MAG: hypothetical protein J2P46_08390 [Zavarzinella sp.]|nr:hypothetical protein [Zavarzinella sp.]